MMNFNDQQALAFVQGQAFKVNQRIYETKYPSYDFPRLIYVDTSGPEWSPGVITYTSDMTGAAKWQAGGAKDVPMADVSQDRSMRSHHLAAIGYEWHIEEVNTALNIGGGLPDRRARAAREAYMKFMHDVTVKGDTEKGLGGLINYQGVITKTAAAVGTGNSTLWVNAAGIGQKTPDQIMADIDDALSGVFFDTYETELADTLLLPFEAYRYISRTKVDALSDETILSFVKRTNLYTQETGRELTIRGLRDLSAAAPGGTGRMVAYKNDENYVKLHLPMPHRFLNVYQSGPMQWQVPGIFRTGGVELLTTKAMRYVDGISEPRAA